MESGIKPIGRVCNQVREPRDSGWGQVLSEVRLDPEFAPGLAGLGDFSHAVVVFLMHESRFSPRDHLLRRPQERADMPALGIFAQRAKHRPNPIGITTVAIDRIDGGSMFVRGLDAIDGTPILDVKPHVAAYDAPADTRAPEWIGRLMQGYF